MIKVFVASWALFLGMFMLMVGNGLQGTLLGIRGGLENFSTFEMSIVMSAYFLGFLGGSRAAPEMIRRVGHVRVFAALGSTISAVLILYPVLPEVWAWTLGRVVIGFCFSGVYVTAESWLNNAATNENRGQSLWAVSGRGSPAPVVFRGSCAPRMGRLPPTCRGGSCRAGGCW